MEAEGERGPLEGGGAQLAQLWKEQQEERDRRANKEGREEGKEEEGP